MSKTVIWGWTGKEATLEDAQSRVGEGWADLVEKCWNILIAQEEPQLIQVKEKFGGLRFYCTFKSTGHGGEIFDQIGAIETQSFDVCEFCGDGGKPRRQRHWVKTLCDDCDARYDEIRKKRWENA